VTSLKQHLALLLLWFLLFVYAVATAQQPRLARQLPPEAAARAAARRRHNEALRALFAETGLPTGSDPASVEARARAVEAVNAAISNRAEVASGVTADSVAAAVAALAAPASTNDTQKGQAK
jgi:putative exporter of polyketide antibiotics